MKLNISAECIACGLCADSAPALFQMKEDESAAEVIRHPQTPDEEELAKDAASACPVEAIHLE